MLDIEHFYLNLTNCLNMFDGIIWFFYF